MTPWLEFEGKNIDKALQIASENLSLSMEDMKYDIISYGSSGIFGIVGVKKAKIRVYCTPVEDPKTVDIETNRALNAERLPESPVIDDIRTRRDAFCANSVETDRTITIGDEDDSSRIRVQQVKALLETIVKAITGNAGEASETNSTIQVKCDEKRMIFTIGGDNCHQLIGRRGQTLESIQYVMDRVINKNSQLPRMRLVIDVEGYHEKRQAELVQLANRLAEKVIRNGRSIAIGKLNPSDRKMVHLALKDNPQIKTQSLGDGFIRKLMIIPKKAGQHARNHVDKEN